MRSYRITIVLLVAFVGLCIGILMLSPFKTEYCDNYKTQDKENCPAYNVILVAWWKIGEALSNSAFVTALATVAIATFTGTIYYINRSQLQHAHQVERAYLSGGGVLGTEAVKPAIPLASTMPGGLNLPSRNMRVFELAINNHGKTPERLLQIGANVCESNAIPESPDYQWRHSFDWIGPGTQSRRYGEIKIPTHLRNPIVYARFRYRDIFGDEHSCGFIQRGSESIPAPAAYTDWD